MIGLSIILEGDGAFEDWKDRRTHRLGNNAPAIRLAALRGGMTSGRTSVVIGIDLPDGSVVMAETSLRLLLAAAKAFEAKYGDELDG